MLLELSQLSNISLYIERHTNKPKGSIHSRIDPLPRLQVAPLITAITALQKMTLRHPIAILSAIILSINQIRLLPCSCQIFSITHTERIGLNSVILALSINDTKKTIHFIWRVQHDMLTFVPLLLFSLKNPWPKRHLNIVIYKTFWQNRRSMWSARNGWAQVKKICKLSFLNLWNSHLNIKVGWNDKQE